MLYVSINLCVWRMVTDGFEGGKERWLDRLWGISGINLFEAASWGQQRDPGLFHKAILALGLAIKP